MTALYQRYLALRSTITFPDRVVNTVRTETSTSKGQRIKVEGWRKDDKRKRTER